MTPTVRSKAEENFIDQCTRKLLVEWAKQSIAFGGLSEPAGARMIYFDHALAKGWLTKREPHRLTAKGFGVAASFLKR